MEAMYKGFKIIETMQEGGATTSVAYLFDEDEWYDADGNEYSN